jgi:hypothetical protein
LCYTYPDGYYTEVKPMTIPPIGQTPPTPPPADDRPAGTEGSNRQETRRAEQDEAGRERVEFSPEAERIRNRQREITRLQIAERTARENQRDDREIRRMLAEQTEARRAHDDQRVRQIRDRLEERLHQVAQRNNEARFEGERVLDGREMRFSFADGEEVVRTPDAERDAQEHARQVREAADGRREAPDEDFGSRMDRFADRAQAVRTRLEKDVRDSIAGAVRESSNSRPRDAADAERMLREAAQARETQSSERPSGVEQIASRAVNLLQ